MGYYGYGMHAAGAGGGAVFLLFLLFILFLSLLGLLMLVKSKRHHIMRSDGAVGCCGHPAVHGFPTATASEDEALSIARLRYARGEIDRGQYEELLRILTGSGPSV